MPLHVVQRGNNRIAMFHYPEDFVRFRDILHAESGRFRCAIHAYVFMTNHVHLLITPEHDRGPSRMMQAIGRRFVHYMNTRYRRTGTLWEGRFRSSLVDSEQYMFACSRYIELNPVRARMTGDPSSYPWSSYRHNALGLDDRLITRHALYDALGVGPGDRQAAYRGLFEEVVGPVALDAIRHAVNTGDVLGDDAFRAWVAASLERSVARPRRGGDRRRPEFQPA